MAVTRNAIAMSMRTSVAARASPGDVLPSSYCEFPPTPAGSRRAGVVLHPTSFASPHGMGDLGEECTSFLDWVVASGLRVWQVLPLVPPGRPIPGVREDYWSPYSGRDANCGNVLLVSLERLAEDGLLSPEEVPAAMPLKDCDFNAAARVKEPVIEKAAEALLSLDPSSELAREFDAFLSDDGVAEWLSDSALFSVIESDEAQLGMNWWDWPVELRDRHEAAMARVRDEKRREIKVFEACQFLFHRQWMAVKRYANENKISIVGDMPIYVGGHSADVWANRALFELDGEGRPTEVSGVPPDAFSDTGQLWGSPLYRWPAHKNENFAWWTRRLRRAFVLYDEVRIDHFRGFAGFWSVPAENDTAMIGAWRAGPGRDLFDSVARNLGDGAAGSDGSDRLPIMAEDLGVITPDVTALRKAIDAPGMVVLQFAFGSGPENTHLMHNYEENMFVYPATHDNDTTVGWWSSVSENDKRWVRNYTGAFLPDSGRAGGRSDDDIAWLMTRLAFTSVADSAVVVMQDVLSLGNDARMNTPGVADGNWMWRMKKTNVRVAYRAEAERLRRLVYLTGRLDRDEDAPVLPSRRSRKLFRRAQAIPRFLRKIFASR